MKPFMQRIALGFGAKLPLMLQTEAAECGLACLGMVAGFQGQSTDLASLRRRFPVSLKGVTLATLMRVANRLGLVTRPLKLDLKHLPQLRLPCVLHWEFNHFVVLKELRAGGVTLHDPAFGERRLSLEEFGQGFTGVALELWPGTDFRKQDTRRRVSLGEVIGPITGLRRSLGQVLLLAGALELFTLITPFFQQWIVDDVIVSADRTLLTTLALGFGLLLIAQQATEAIRAWVLMVLSTTLNVQWRANVFTRLLELPVAYFEKRHLGDVVSRFGSIDIMQRTLTTSLIEAILDGATSALTLTLMFLYSARLAAVALASLTLYGLGRWIWFAPLRRAREDQIVHAAKQQSHFLETVRGVKVLKLFQRQDERRSGWLSLLIDQVNAELRSQKLALLYRSLNGALFGIENILILWWGAILVLDHHFSVGLLIAFLAYKTQFDTRVASLIDKFIDFKMIEIQAERLADIISSEPEAVPAGALQEDRNLPATIEVRDLKFRYADTEPHVLDGVSLKIDSGESVAIVGPSGGGKTTLLNVMLGIHPPTDGEVLVGGIRLKDLGLDAMRAMIGTVLQDDVLFAGSIAENVSFFDPHANQAWIEECASLAAIHEDIASMPMGYNTLVGDMGTVLSGGQKQRVLLARALYKRPKILFLDEATSHLDLEREQAVNASIKALDLTRIIIAHRPETIASADRVLTLREGRIIEDTSQTAQNVSQLRPSTNESCAA